MNSIPTSRSYAEGVFPLETLNIKGISMHFGGGYLHFDSIR